MSCSLCCKFKNVTSMYDINKMARCLFLISICIMIYVIHNILQKFSKCALLLRPRVQTIIFELPMIKNITRPSCKIPIAKPITYMNWNSCPCVKWKPYHLWFVYFVNVYCKHTLLSNFFRGAHWAKMSWNFSSG